MADNFDTVTAVSSSRPASEVSDIELVARVNATDELAFEELFNRHKRRVALIAGRFFRQREQVEEIVQESFTKAHFGLSDFANQQENSFASWIARIAFNSCYDELRRMKRRPESSLSDISAEDSIFLNSQLHSNSAAPSNESTTIKRDLAEKLLAQLDPEDRLVLVMLDIEDMSVADIAELNNWSVSKVKVRAHRARVRLRKILKRFM